MKESPRRYTNPFLSDEENEKINLWNNQDLERLNISDNLTNNYEEDKLKTSLLPSQFPEKETEFYTDKSVVECELPELLVCYKDGSFHVKDICVDDGISKGESVLFDENNNEMSKPEELKFTPFEDFYTESKDVFVFEPSNSYMDNEENRDEVIQRKSDASCGSHEVDADKDCEDNAAKERGTQEESDKLKVSAESDSVSNLAESYGPDISLSETSEQVISNSEPSLQQDQPFPSLKSLLEAIENQESCENPVELTSKTTISNEHTTEENNALNLNNNEPPTTSSGVHKVENPSIDSVPKDQDIGSNNVAMMHPVYRGSEGESSFSVAGPVSGLITYSGPIAFSGSISLRSDSSTTSTRSFAFPILQNEWNSSPVRMAKADRRRLQKHRGWRHGLLCCRF